jgi:Icc-related predicted phosphoesterase
MRVLAFSDIHNDWSRLRQLLSENADLYVVAGDLTYNERGITKAYEIMKPFLEKIYIVPGNNETVETIAALFPNHVHGRVLEYNGVKIGGIGGAPRTPWHSAFDWDEDYAYNLLEKLGPTDIFVSHAPPKESKTAITTSGHDVGSEAVRWYIDTYQPEYAVVGHVHERAGTVERIGKTVVFNPGPMGKLLVIGEVDGNGEPI